MGFSHSTAERQGHSDPGAERGLERVLIWLPTQANPHYPELSPRHPDRCEHAWAFAHLFSSRPPFNPKEEEGQGLGDAEAPERLKTCPRSR